MSCVPSVDTVRALLAFVISDLTPDTYGQLQGLRLAPLANTHVGVWGRPKYVCATPAQQALTPLLADHMLDADAVTSHSAHFTHASFQHLYLIPFTPMWLSEQMPRLYTSPHYTSYKHKTVQWSVSRVAYMGMQEEKSEAPTCE